MLEMDFIHAHSHQLNSSLIVGFRTLHNGRVQNGSRVKALSFVLDNDEYFVIRSTPATDVNLFRGVLAVAVKHGIAQGCPQSDFNISLVSGNTIRFSDEMYKLLHDRQDSG